MSTKNQNEWTLPDRPEWLTAQEIADEKLPDIGRTRGMVLLWMLDMRAMHPKDFRRGRRTRRTGGRAAIEFHYSLMPPCAVSAYWNLRGARRA